MNTNTIEEFRTIDKNQLFQQITEKVIKPRMKKSKKTRKLIIFFFNKVKHAVQSGEALKDPTLLGSFLLITFADLKKYKFYYWFAFPAIMPQPDPWLTSHKIPINTLFSDSLVKYTASAILTLAYLSFFF